MRKPASKDVGFFINGGEGMEMKPLGSKKSSGTIFNCQRQPEGRSAETAWMQEVEQRRSSCRDALSKSHFKPAINEKACIARCGLFY